MHLVREKSMYFSGDKEFALISLFIGPAILAAIISGFFSLILLRRSERVKNITAERSKWRKKIRQISEKIQPNDVNKLENALNSLKLHINAYGIEDYVGDVVRFEARYIMVDTHIWVLLYRIEHMLHEKRKVDGECELLRKYLSLLLKYDWERAKGELNHSISIILGWMAMMVSIIGLFIIPLYHGDSFRAADGKIILSAILGIITILVTVALFEWKTRNRLRQDAASEYNGFKNVSGKIVDVYERLRPYVNLRYNAYVEYSTLYKTGSFLMIYFILTRIWQRWGVERSFSIFAYIGFIAIYILGALLVSIDNKKTITNEYTYIVEINRISSKFYELKEISIGPVCMT